MGEKPGRTSGYKQIFEMIEGIPECSTADAYDLYHDGLKHSALDPSIYLSMAITSGGYARDEKLGFVDAMNKNGDYVSLVARAIGEQYKRHVDLNDIVVPSDLGKVSGWSQADYLLFWAHVITGMDPREARMLDEAVHASGAMQLAGFHDKSISREDRWNDYKTLIDTYADSFDDLRAGRGLRGADLPRNMQAVVLALDPQESLGVNAERYLCYRLGLGEYVCQIPTDDAALVSAAMELSELGAATLKSGSGDVSGIVNHEAVATLRRKGVKFLESGIISGVFDRKSYRGYVLPIEPPKSNEELWTEYYAAKCG